MADPVDIDAIHVERAGQCRHDGEPWPCATRQRDRARDEVDRLRAENAALRALVARFYTQAWEDPLTDDEMALLDPIVNDAMREATGG